MKIIENILYAPEFGSFGAGDLYLPETLTEKTPLFLCIHGGAWNSLDKSRMNGICDFLCSQHNAAIFNINYRFCRDAKWPGCGNDCLAAADFILKDNIPELKTLKNKKLFVIGGSSGGHLALMTGLRLPPEQVKGIISLSGVNSISEDHTLVPGRYFTFFGHEGQPSAEEFKSAEPAEYLSAQSPPILCTHDTADNVVSVKCTEKFSAAAAAAGAACSCYFYCKNETGVSHRMFIPDTVRLYPDIESTISNFIKNNI